MILRGGTFNHFLKDFTLIQFNVILTFAIIVFALISQLGILILSVVFLPLLAAE
jgi:hypothetical protein